MDATKYGNIGAQGSTHSGCEERDVFYVNSTDPMIAFEMLRRSPYFVDKTGLASAVIPSIRAEQRHICITRPRRFGKTINARMLACFLTRGLDAAPLFEGLEVTHDEAAMAHLGKHDVIYIDFSALPDEYEGYRDYIDYIRSGILEDLRREYPGIGLEDIADVPAALKCVRTAKKSGFVFVMDEWDSIFFNDRFTKEDQKDFLMFLKQLLKLRPYVELAYMTGIMPIAKHSSGSELNMFVEYSAASDPRYERFFGFTEDEVHALCAEHLQRKPDARVGYDDLALWYDGYLAKDGSRRFNPRSVVCALGDDDLRSYWTESGPYDEIYWYVRNNVCALRDDLARMVAGEAVEAEMENYAATSMSLGTRDEILSAMVVYGFLTYHDGYVSIPNHELMLKFQKLMKKDDMGYVARLAKRSKETLAATLRGDAETVASVVEAAHDEEVPLLRYANEADLAAVVNLVYLAARDRYEVRREQPSGKGVADVSFIPRDPRDALRPPFTVGLKVEGSVAGAVAQIRERDYLGLYTDGTLAEPRYAARPLAVGIVWDPKTKTHDCAIEEL